MDSATGVTAHAARTPDKPALVLGDSVVTYADLDARSTRLAHALRHLGVPDDGVIAVMLGNSVEFVEVGVAVGKLAAHLVPVNWHLRAEEAGWIIADSGAQVLVAHVSLRTEVTAALGHAPGCALLLVGSDGPESYAAAVAAGAGPALDSGPAWLPTFYTSGTTGRPKGVVHGYLDRERMGTSMAGQVALWWWTADDVYLLCGPAYHAASGGWVMAALFVGATTVIMPTWDAVAWLDLVDRHRVTRSVMVPAHFIRILEVAADQRAQRDLTSLSLIVHGAAPCPVDVKRRFMAAVPAQVWELYGGSEGGATKIGPADWLARPGSVGQPWPGVEVRVLDEAGAAVPAGETGVIFIKPALGMRFHYHRDEAKTTSVWREDAFTIGDMGHLDGDGFLFVTDRLSDLVIRGGVNIYPREIEEVLITHPAVVDCTVFGVPDERNGEELRAVVETRAPTSAEDIRTFLGEHLAGFKVPRHVEFVPELPRDPNGKVRKRALRDQHWQGRAI